MDRNQNLPMGRQQVTVVRVNNDPSPKNQLFSTVVSIQRVAETEFGKSYANIAIGLIFTEKKPDFRIGESVNVDIVTYQTGINPNNGQEVISGRCIYINRIASDERVKVAGGMTAENANA